MQLYKKVWNMSNVKSARFFSLKLSVLNMEKISYTCTYKILLIKYHDRDAPKHVRFFYVTICQTIRVKIPQRK